MLLPDVSPAVSPVSIVVPALDEREALPRTLAALQGLSPPPLEVLVVDGGSTDGTPELAAGAGASVLRAPAPGRGRQMNLGAEHARGEILCFVHADTWLPPDAMEIVVRTLDRSDVALGGFISLMTGTDRTRWFTSLHNTVKTVYAPLLFRPIGFFARHLRLLFGDQVMFCRREQFLRCGGFDPEQSVMEEADLCLKLSRFGKVVQLRRTVWSSDRRVAKWGFWRAHALYLAIGLMWGFGVPSRWLRRLYPEVR